MNHNRRIAPVAATLALVAIAVSLVAVLIIGGPASAQPPRNGPSSAELMRPEPAGAEPVWAEPAPSAPPTPQDLPTIINNARVWIMSIIAAVATFFLTVGGARYLMAGGDPAEVERAKGSFKSAGVGYALAILAPVVLTIFNKILGG
jgi:hypothetical protein